MPNLNRRDFLKALGVGSASTLAACGVDNNNYATPVELLLPYVVRPDQVVPGTPTFFATAVQRGPHARAVTARHRDGRVIFVSHNRYAPERVGVGKGDLLALQQHYSPDRLRGPVEGGASIAWDAGLQKLADAVKAAKAAGKRVVFLSGYKSGPIVELARDFTGGDTIFWEPTGYAAEAAAAEALFGRRVLPWYGLHATKYLVSFGAPFLSGWGDPGISNRWARARNPNEGHFVARFALIAPYRDLTGASADDWFAPRPGTEVSVARAIGALVAEKTGAAPAIRAAIGQVDVESVAQASGLTAETLRAVAENLVAGDGLVLPGGANGSVELAAATYLINLALGAAPTRFHLGGYAGPVDGVEKLEALVADLNAGRVGVLIVDDANPVYALPKLGFAEAAAKADLFVSVDANPSETAALAKLRLPTSGALEDWGAEAPVQGTWLLRQPAMSPLYDTRSLGDVFLAVGRAAGLGVETVAAAGEETPANAGALGFAPANWKEYVQTWWAANVPAVSDDPLASWEQSLVQGVRTVTPDVAAVAPALAGSVQLADAQLAGDGDVVLVSYAHPHRGDGRWANEPWAQETSDPLTGNVWDSWLEVSPALAKKLGVERNDVVELATSAGSVKVAVHVTRTVRDDVVVLAFGQGHGEAAGRYAKNRGVNAFALYPSPNFLPVRASIRRTGEKGDLVSTFNLQTESQEGRAFGVSVSAEKLAAVGDAPAHHPGELTGIHHLQLDKRLRDQKIEGFYGTPDHPTYRFGMTVDTNACVGCWTCSIACYAENNIPVVGKDQVRKGREMAWLRINRYWEDVGEGQDEVHFVPMLCQHCGHAGCENVCPVLATYHNIDGLNAMVYNRCVGTRYCSNACPFSVRRFNYHTFGWPEPFNLQLNPDVSVREMGVMEKCTFCVQRLRSTKAAWRNRNGFNAVVPDAEWRNVPACVEACPTGALTFGNLVDPESVLAQTRKSARTYEILEELRPLSAINYLARASFHHDPTAGHHGGGEHAEPAPHGEQGDAAHEEG